MSAKATKKRGGRKFAATFSPIAVGYDFPTKGASKESLTLAAKMPRGSGRFWGIPWRLAGEKEPANVLRVAEGAKATIGVGGKRASHVCFLHYWEARWDYRQCEAGGQVVAEYEIHYADGQTVTVPVRAGYELLRSERIWGQQPYAAVPMNDMQVFDFMNPAVRGKYVWGRMQTDSEMGSGSAWIYAHENTRPDVAIDSITVQGMDEDAVCVAGLTLYEGPGHPLRHNPRRYFKLKLPKGAKLTSLDVDMGVLVRDAGNATPRDRRWLKAADAGLGIPKDRPEGKENVRILEATAGDGATLTAGTRTGDEERTHRLSMGEAYHAGSSRDGGVRLSISHPRRRWVRVTVRDEKTRRPIAARVHFSGPAGEYYAPYGHHTVVNDNWFEDYGADLRLGQVSYAYVQGTFETQLPVGELYVEALKGFEYEPLRKRITVGAGQRELELTLRRWTDRSKDGWVTADTHVHFLSPHTAWLQGQCEGLNLINLLASQWGRLFTNVGDITGEVGVEKDNTMVWVGTENRNHILGHISMLGTRGQPVFPMCAGGPTEAYLGDPDERTLAEWAEECRRKRGVVIRPHFPQPNLENPVDIILGRIDGLEISNATAPPTGPLDAFMLREYYRYLNCGYRVACVGGTDKMSAGMPVGGIRTYAKLDRNRAFDFANWGAAVRGGRTFSTSGPLLDLTVDGHSVGEEIRMKGGRGTVEVHALAESAWPIHRLEVVKNGEIVATAERKAGASKLEIRTPIPVEGPGWIAARCASTLKKYHTWPGYLAAHTSPVYIAASGKRLFSPSDATYMLTLIDGGLTYLDTLSVRYSEQRHREMKAVYRKAQAALRARMPK